MGNTPTRKNPYNTANDPIHNNQPAILFLPPLTKPPPFQQLPYFIKTYLTSYLELPDCLLLSTCSRRQFRKTKWTLPSHCNDLRIPPHIRPFFPRWCKRIFNGQKVLSTSFSGKKREDWQKPTSVLHNYHYSANYGQPEGDGTSQEVKGEWIIALLEVCPRLQNLTLYHSTHSFNSETLCQIISKSNENFDLISLLRHSGAKVDERVIDAFIKHLAKFPTAEGKCHFTRLNLDRMILLSNAIVHKLLHSTSLSLTHLNLYCCLSLTNDVMNSIGKYCPSLIHLSLGSCNGLSQKPTEPLLTLIHGCTQLKRLSLYNNQAVTDEWLDIISTTNDVSKLAILNLSLCEGITGHGVTRLIDALLPSLRTLDLLTKWRQNNILPSFNPSGNWRFDEDGSPVHRNADGKIPSLRVRHDDFEKCQTASFRPDSSRGHQCMFAIGEKLRIRGEKYMKFASNESLAECDLNFSYFANYEDPTYKKDLPTLFEKEKTIDEYFMDQHGIVVRNDLVNNYGADCDQYLLERKVCNHKTNKIRALCYWVESIHLAHVGEEFKEIIKYHMKGHSDILYRNM